MKDNISTRIVLEQALQLANRYPLDVRSCKARWLTCQEALYRNSEQQNATLEANCHKEENLFEKRAECNNDKESPQRFRKVRGKSEYECKIIQTVQCRKIRMWGGPSGLKEGKKLHFSKINVGEVFWTKILLSTRICSVHSHLVAAAYNPPPTADQRALPPEQVGGGVKCFT